MKILLLLLLSSSFINTAFAVKIGEIEKNYNNLIHNKIALIPHEGTYILPVSYSEKPNNKPYEALSKSSPERKDRGDFAQKMEAEFQFSFLVMMAQEAFESKYDLFIGFTQRSYWQVYNGDWSRPFRESNYKPEVFVRDHFENSIDTIFGGKIKVYDFGYVHQSNGQVQELSRSWDRIFFRTLMHFDRLFLKLTLWHRVTEEREEDDNPDLYKYLGYGELDFRYIWEGQSYNLRIIPGVEKQGLELSYSSPWKEGLRFYTKIGHGYGLSLQDYDHNHSRIGIGFILSDFLTAQ